MADDCRGHVAVQDDGIVFDEEIPTDGDLDAVRMRIGAAGREVVYPRILNRDVVVDVEPVFAPSLADGDGRV
jgi:hypothetical protein